MDRIASTSEPTNLRKNRTKECVSPQNGPTTISNPHTQYIPLWCKNLWNDRFCHFTFNIQTLFIDVSMFLHRIPISSSLIGQWPVPLPLEGNNIKCSLSNNVRIMHRTTTNCAYFEPFEISCGRNCVLLCIYNIMYATALHGKYIWKKKKESALSFSSSTSAIDRRYVNALEKLVYQ